MFSTQWAMQKLCVKRDKKKHTERRFTVHLNVNYRKRKSTKERARARQKTERKNNSSEMRMTRNKMKRKRHPKIALHNAFDGVILWSVFFFPFYCRLFCLHFSLDFMSLLSLMQRHFNAMHFLLFGAFFRCRNSRTVKSCCFRTIRNAEIYCYCFILDTATETRINDKMNVKISFRDNNKIPADASTSRVDKVVEHWISHFDRVSRCWFDFFFRFLSVDYKSRQWNIFFSFEDPINRSLKMNEWLSKCSHFFFASFSYSVAFFSHLRCCLSINVFNENEQERKITRRTC